MPIDRDVLEAVREMDEHELRRLLILAKARLDQHGVALPDGASPKVGLRSQWVKCGKTTCTSAPSEGSGVAVIWTPSGVTNVWPQAKAASVRSPTVSGAQEW